MSMLKLLKRWPAITSIRSVGPMAQGGDHDVSELLHHAVKIRCQNVADYYWSHPQEHWKVRDDFPNIAPCWPLAYFEWRNPVQDHYGVSLPSVEMGALLSAYEHSEPVISTITGEPVRWTFHWLVFMATGSIIDVIQIAFNVSDQGRAIPLELRPDGSGVYSCQVIWPRNPDTARPMLEADPSTTSGEILANAGFAAANVPLAALTFANCSNTRITEAPSTNWKPSVARRRQQQGQTDVIWHLLEIGGTRKLLAASGNSETGLKQRLHIARGHFKSFEKGKGLFGRHHGLYWWDQQSRGSRIKGEVRKAYVI
jgi:hypothetical protein